MQGLKAIFKKCPKTGKLNLHKKSEPQEVLLLFNDAPYGEEKANNALRMATQIQNDYETTELYVLLMADVVPCALTDQNNPN